MSVSGTCPECDESGHMTAIGTPGFFRCHNCERIINAAAVEDPDR